MRKFRLISNDVRARSCHAIMAADDGSEVIIRDGDIRTLDQNAALWAMLHDIAQQKAWHGIQLTPEEWKDLFSAGLKRTKAVPNIDGTGFVILGQSTSHMSRKNFSDLLELIAAWGNENGVKWSDVK